MELFYNAGACSVGAEEIFTLDREGHAGDVIAEEGSDAFLGTVIREREECGGEAGGEGVSGGVFEEEGLEEGLREVERLTRRGGFVVSFALGIVAPGVDAGVFFVGHWWIISSSSPEVEFWKL